MKQVPNRERFKILENVLDTISKARQNPISLLLSPKAMSAGRQSQRSLKISSR